MKKVLVVVLIVIITGITLYSEKSVEIDILQSMQSRDYQKAISSIKNNINKVTKKDYFSYLMGIGYINLKKYDVAENVFLNLIKKYPSSKWVIKSKYKLAYVYSKKRKFKKAYDIYLKQLSYLTSDKRRKEFLQIYEKLAKNNAFNENKAKRNYKKAVAYFTKAIEIGTIKKQDEEMLKFQLGKTYVLWKKYYQSRKIFSKFLKKYKNSKLLDKVNFYLAQSYFHTYKKWESRKYYKAVIEKYPNSKFVAQSAYQMGKSFNLPYARSLMDLELGIKYLKIGYKKVKQKKYSPLCLNLIATSYSRWAQFKNRAITNYLKFVKVFSKHKKAGESLVNAAKLYLSIKNYNRSVAVYRRFLNSYPNHSLWQSAQRNIINVSFVRAENEYNNKDYNSSKNLLASFIKSYPLDRNVPRAMFIMADILFKQKKYKDAIKQYEDLFSRYKYNSYANKGMLKAASIYAQQLGDYKKSIKTYEKIKYGHYRRIAKKEIKNLKKPFISFEVKKLYLSNQKPKINIKVKNQKEIKVNIYKINLLDYFYKTHSMSGVENLDILLISPDKSFSHKIKKYKKHKTYKLDLNLPISKSGGYVVQLVTKQLTSTALVLISDIAVMNQSDRNNVFIYTKNLKTKKGQKNVEVFVSNGNKIIFKGKTDNQGVFKANLKKLAKLEGIRPGQLIVLAKYGNNYTSNRLSMRGLRTLIGKKTKAYIFGDKPVYQTGDTIQYKAILRQIVNGELKGLKQKKYKVSFSTPAGSVIYEKVLEINENGSLNGKIKLDPAMSVGNGRLSITSTDRKVSFYHYFKIRKYTPPKTEITIETDRQVYFPGDKIKVSVKIFKLFGMAYANKEIKYSVNGGEYKKAKTNSQGIAKFSVDSQKHRRRNYLTLKVIIAEGNTAYKRINFKTYDFKLSVTTGRKLYLTEEKIPLLIKTKDLEDKKISKKIEIVVYSTGTNIRKEVLRKTVVTRNGLAKTSINLKKGGKYTVSVTGMGKNKIPLTISHSFSVAGKKHPNKVFILNDETEIKVNKTLKLKLFSRAANDRALLIVSAEKILEYREINLSKGKNIIPVKVKDNFSPNARISVCLLNREGSYFAYKDISVKKSLNIAVKGLKKKYLPGQKVTFSIATQNINKRNVNSEVAVAVVDEAVFQAYGDKIKDIVKAFYEKRVLYNYRFSGSMPFKYKSLTRLRNKEILREGRERQIAASGNGETDADRMFTERRRSRTAPRGGFGAGARGGLNEAVQPQPAPSLRRPSEGQRQLAGRITSTADRRSREDSSRTSLRQFDDQTGRVSVPDLRHVFKETAYFLPVLNVKGKAKVSFKLPHNITKWRVIVIGTSGKTLFGSKVSYFKTSRPQMVEINTPAVLYQGDSIRLTANVFNSTKKKVRSKYKLTVRRGQQTIGFDGNYTVGPMGSTEISANQAVTAGRQNKLSLTCQIRGDRARREIPINPWSQIQVRGVSGYSDRSIVRYFDLPEGYPDKKLIFKIYPHSVKVLEKLRLHRNYFLYPFTSQAAASLMTDMSLFRAIKDTGEENNSRVILLKEDIKRKILLIQAFMLRDGSYNWIKFKRIRDVYTTVFNFYALAYAKKLGFKLNKVKMKRIKRYLLSNFHRTSNLEKKALILWSLSHYGEIDFSYINRLYRLRSSLSVRGLALLSMILTSQNRSAQAENILGLLNRQHKEFMWKIPENKGVDFFSTREEVSSLVLMALIRAKRYPELIKKGARRLLVELERTYRPTDLFQALFSDVFAGYLLKYAGGQGQFELTLKLNNKKIFFKKLGPKIKYLTKIFGNNLTYKKKNKLEIIINGRGGVSYSAFVNYSKPGYVKENVKKYGYIKKYLLYPKYVVNGKTLDRGYSSVHGNYSREKNIQKLKRVARNQVFPVYLNIKLKDYKEKYFILRDYIPAGCRVVPKSVRGNFVYYQQRGNELIIYIKRGKYSRLGISYQLLSMFEGSYRMLPPRISPFRNPSKEIIGKSMKLKVMPERYNTFIAYKFTPNELYKIAKYYFEKKNYKKTNTYLNKLLKKYTLRDYYYKEVCRMQLFSNLKLQNHREVVKYFDILKERYPDLELNLEEVKKIAKSYANIGEHERAQLLLRDLMEAYFSQESQIGRVLVNSDKTKQSIKVMTGLFRSYPDTSTVKNVYYSFGQELYNKFTSLENLKKRGKKGKMYYSNARNIFVNFLSEHPDFGSADEVSFTFLNLLLDKKRYTDLYNASKLFAKRYPKSKFIADYKYLSAYGLFNLGKFEKAISYAKDVGYKKFISPDGIKRYSKNRYFAIHMLAKIYHAMGKMELAVKEYRKVASKFADARHSLKFLKNRNIFIPEVTRVKPGKKAVIKVRTKGLKNFEIKVYKVDFVILCLSKTDLSNIRNVNLTGIKSSFTKKITLNNVSDDIMVTSIEAPVSKKGAYLVVLKSDEIETSGIILISNIRAEIQPDISGRVRVLIRDRNGKRISKVKTFFVGSYGKKVKRSSTDLRGFSEAEGVMGIPIVFGEYKGNYVFYRGRYVIGARPIRRYRPRPIYRRRRIRKRKIDILRNIFRRRDSIQIRQRREFEANTTRDIRQYKIRQLMQ